MGKQIINTKNAPSAVGSYSQAVKVGNLLFTSGQIPLDPVSGELVSDDVKKATERVLENLKAILEEANTSFDKVVKITIFLRDMDDLATVNEVYAQYFITDIPARSCVQVAKLPKDALLEVDVIALL